MKWRILLACGCTYLIKSNPDLAGPYLCGFKNDKDHVHGLVMIERAERLHETT